MHDFKYCFGEDYLLSDTCSVEGGTISCIAVEKLFLTTNCLKFYRKIYERRHRVHSVMPLTIRQQESNIFGCWSTQDIFSVVNEKITKFVRQSCVADRSR